MPRGNPEAYMKQGMPREQAMRLAAGAGPAGAGDPSMGRPGAMPGGGLGRPVPRPMPGGAPGGRPMPQRRPMPQGRPMPPQGGGDIKVHVQAINDALKAIAAISGVEIG